MEIIDQEECIFDDSNQRDQTILQSLHYARSGNVLTDVILCADDCQIPCHRIVLAVSSDYFMAMFTSKFRESKMTKIDLSHLNGEALTIIVNYFYSSILKFPKSAVRNVLETSDLLQVAQVVDHCTEVILNEIQIDECLEIFRYADNRISLKDLKSGALKMIWEHFDYIKDMEEFIDLSADNLIDIISSSSLISGEEDVFESVITWYNRDTNRLKDLLLVLEHIRFNLMSDEYLSVMENFLTNDLNISLRSIQNAREFHSSTSSMKHQLLSNMEERRSYQDVVVVYKMAHEPGRRLQMYFATPEVIRENLQQGEHDEEVVEFAQVAITQDQPISLCDDVKAITRFGSSVFVCTATGVEVVDPSTGARSFTDVTLPKDWFPLTAETLEGLVYVVQGNENGSAHSIVCFDKWRREWDKCASFPFEVFSPTLVAYESELFLFGTNDTGTIVQSYDPCTDKWHQGVPLQECHCFCGGCPLIAVDEEESSTICLSCPDHIHTYNPHSDAWQTIDLWAQLATSEELSGPNTHCIPVACNGNCFLYFDDTSPNTQIGSNLSVLRLSPYTGNWTACQFEFDNQTVTEEDVCEIWNKNKVKHKLIPPPAGQFKFLKCITICRK